MDKEKPTKILKILKKNFKNLSPPLLQLREKTGNSPFRILIATLLSLRTRDETTAKCVEKLFRVADTPQKILEIPTSELEKLIYPVGFYKKKAVLLKEVSKIILEKFNGKVPDNLNDLLSLPGVGRKTANIVLSRAFNKPAISVDTHVHRISNRLGLVKTKKPEETEEELKKIFPEKLWKEVNELLVALGQTICHPTSPKCSECPVESLCPKIGVERKR